MLDYNVSDVISLVIDNLKGLSIKVLKGFIF